MAALSVAKYKDRPESVYFFKRGMYPTIVDIDTDFFLLLEILQDIGIIYISGNVNHKKIKKLC